MERIMLNHEASAGDTHKQVSTELPAELVQCLEKNRFLHLATCSTDNMPHVSLMNFTYLPSSTYSASAVIVMTANPASKKMNNVAVNPNVSLLVHDWISPMPPSNQRRMSGASGNSGRDQPRSNSLVPLLFNMNTSAVARISATMNGTARLVARGSDEERFYRAAHLENTGYDEEEEVDEGRVVVPELRSQVARRVLETEAGFGGRSASFVAGEDVRVVLVDIRSVRIADLDGGVRDWEILKPANANANAATAATSVEDMVNEI